MSPSNPAAQSPAPRRRGLRDLTLGVLAALALLVGLVGVPLLLYLVAPLTPPGSWPSWGDLFRPDDGRVLQTALGLVAWAGWAVFALSAVLEIVAVVRGTPTPRLPLLHTPQALAAALVATAAVLVSAPILSPPPAAAATTNSAPATDTGTPADPVAAASPEREHVGPQRTAGPRHAHPAAPNTDHEAHKASDKAGHWVTVRHGDTLWGLAERHLGTGTRYREIAELNYGRTQPDGRSLTSAHWIYPGWRLRLPTDTSSAPAAHTANGRSTTPQTPKATRTYVVRPGDSLWDIAQHELGDGTRAHELFGLNADRRQPDGHALRNPSLIRPGWVLLLPAPAPAQRPPAEDKPASRPAVPAQRPDPDRTPPAQPDANPIPPATPAPTRPVDDAPQPPTQAATTPSETTDAADAVDRSDSHPIDFDGPINRSTLLALGLTTVTAAGFIAELARRRRHQQRLRGPGQRIAMPEPDSQPATTERALRAGAAANTLTVLTRALDQICAAHAAEQHPPPRLLLAFVSPDTAELTLDPRAAASQEAMQPFALVGSGRWAADITTLRAHLDDATGIAGPRPSESYPALVSLGASHDAVVLANLEAAGTLTLTANDEGEPADAVADVLRALVCELATSPLSSGCTLTLSDEFADLADLTDASRLRILPAPTLVRSLHAHTEQTQAMLVRAAAADAFDARLRGVDDLAPQLWVGPDADHHGTDLADVDRAWSAHCVITTSQTPPGQGWHLKVGNGPARLEPIGVDLVPQHLDPATYADLLELLGTARRPATTAIAEPPENHPPHDVTEVETAHTPSDQPSRDRATSMLLLEPVSPTDHAASQEVGRDDQTEREPTEHEPTEVAAAPRVLLLGPVQIDKPNGHIDLRSRRLTELISYLALRPDAPGPALDEALWNGQRISRGTRNALVYRARTWLGDALDGTAYLPYADTDGYRLHPDVSCDWHDFQRHVRAAGHGDHDPVQELTAALDLVRDRPFLGIDPASYTWAERDTQTMISAIVDVAHQLAQLHLDRQDPTAAHAAALRGLQIDPVSELLYRMAITSAAQRHDAREIQRLEHQLRHQVNALDPDADLDDETLTLLSSLRARA